MNLLASARICHRVAACGARGVPLGADADGRRARYRLLSIPGYLVEELPRLRDEAFAMPEPGGTPGCGRRARDCRPATAG